MKIKLLLSMTILSSLLCISGTAFAKPIEDVKYNTTETNIEPRTDIKEWIYAVIDGDIYKRLYNYTRNRWETDWILVQEGV